MKSLHDILAEEQLLRDHLHDGTQHQLVSMCLHLRLLEERLATTGEMPEASALAHIKDTLSRCAEDLNRLVQARSGTVSGPADELLEAIQALCAGSPIPVEWRIGEGAEVAIREMPHSRSSVVYYTVAESLTNALKHSVPTRIVASVEVTPDGQVQGMIRNNGFDPASGPIRPGSGIEGLRSRLGAHGGTFSISQDTSEVVVNFTLPTHDQEHDS